MPTPLPQLLAEVPALNDPSEPFSYTVDGDTIVARWDIDKANQLHPGEVGELNTEFAVVVSFDEAKGTWKSKDHENTSGWSAGGGGLSWGTSMSSGKSASKGFSVSFGGGDGPKVTTWDTKRMKEPLFAFLEAHGWTKKRGLFG